MFAMIALHSLPLNPGNKNDNGSDKSCGSADDTNRFPLSTGRTPTQAYKSCVCFLVHIFTVYFPIDLTYTRTYVGIYGQRIVNVEMVQPNVQQSSALVITVATFASLWHSALLQLLTPCLVHTAFDLNILVTFRSPNANLGAAASWKSERK